MATVEERVAFLEGRSQEHATAIGDVRADIRELRGEMTRRFDQIDGRFTRIDNKFIHMDNKFTWVIGLQFALLLAFIAALLDTSLR
jgi:hypothetical protein